MQQQKQQTNLNPETHYVDHVQNTSYSKQCHRFGKSQRFSNSLNVNTDFVYEINLPFSKKACGFGYGHRTNFARKDSSPPPNKYNLKKFPDNNRTTTMGYGRAQTVFRSMMNEIGKRKTLPGPAAYQLPETIRSRRFTLKARQPNEIDLKTKQMVPGPGQYSIPSLNPEGRYTISTHKNVRFIIMDGERSSPELKRPPIGPGSYELTSQDDISSQEKINLMRVRPRKTFGVSVRPSPAERTKLFVPGPGMYDTFSEFGEPELSNPSDSKYGRMKTQY